MSKIPSSMQAIS